MSLINQNQSFSVRDYLFLAAGLLGVFTYFMTYSTQEPRSVIEASLDRQSAIMTAAEVANTLGYRTGEFESTAQYQANRQLLDSLQYRLGRSAAIEALSTGDYPDIQPFYWQVEFSREADPSEAGAEMQAEGEQAGPPATPEAGFSILLDDKGRWFSLSNPTSPLTVLPNRTVHRQALEAVFEGMREITTAPDTSLVSGLSFNVTEGYDLADTSAAEVATQPLGLPHRYSADELRRLAAYHFREGGWDLGNYELSSIRIERIKSTPAAHVRFTSSEPILEQDAALQATVTPSGGLIDLHVSYNPTAGTSNDAIPIWELITVAAVFLFMLASIIIFYFRIKARVVDTNSALVISVLIGFIIPVIIFLREVDSIDLFGDGSSWLDLVGLALQMGITGAMAAVGFFMVFSIGDSITRQYWPEKLQCYDYLRQGMFFNKPVGEAVVRSVTLMFILAGFWSVLLWFFPNLFFEIEEPFLTYEVAWAPVYLFFDNFWYSLIIILGIFLVIGGQTYARTGSRWISGGVMVAATAIMAPNIQSLGPGIQEFAIFGVMGGAFALIYLKWDFLTLLLTHYLFLCFMGVSGGWLADNSPDLYLFMTFAMVLLFITAGGAYSLARGKEEQALPGYVPEYVEELAQEERIKQELQIARDVQQSFLPVKTPTVRSLDLAAICKPAHETGGDYYDFIQLDEHRLAVAIGDVSGKGIQAAFYMTFTKGILHSLCRETESPAELLKKANKLFYENAQRGTFISLIYGIVDTRNRTFKFARAGHNPILHVSGATSEMELLQPNGLGLGLTIDASFDKNIQETTLHLQAGDTLVLYTDGIVEALNSAHQFYDTHRLRQQLKENEGKTAGDILDGIIYDVEKFAGQSRQHDDMTIMIVKLEESVMETESENPGS